MTELVVCGRCREAAERLTVNGVLSDPPGWTCLSLMAIPIRNWLLCPACVGIVTAVLILEAAPRPAVTYEYKLMCMVCMFVSAPLTPPTFSIPPGKCRCGGPLQIVVDPKPIELAS